MIKILFVCHGRIGERKDVPLFDNEAFIEAITMDMLSSLGLQSKK